MIEWAAWNSKHPQQVYSNLDQTRAFFLEQNLKRRSNIPIYWNMMMFIEIKVDLCMELSNPPFCAIQPSFYMKSSFARWMALELVFKRRFPLSSLVIPIRFLYGFIFCTKISFLQKHIVCRVTNYVKVELEYLLWFLKVAKTYKLPLEFYLQKKLSWVGNTDLFKNLYLPNLALQIARD